jgi:hypothetical protein
MYKWDVSFSKCIPFVMWYTTSNLGLVV